jgi:hypothetical protein
LTGFGFPGDSEKHGSELRHPDSKYEKKNIFHTSEVLYSTPEVAKILMRLGIVEKKGDVFALTNMKKLKELEQQGKTWESVGLSEQYEKIRIVFADPEKDNPAALFDRFVKQSWSYPLIFGYENFVIELYQSNPAYREKLRDVRVLIPEPTTLISHPFVARTPKGMDFLRILEKPDVREFVGRRYGLRFADSELPAEMAKDLGLPRKIVAVPPSPK